VLCSQETGSGLCWGPEEAGPLSVASAETMEHAQNDYSAMTRRFFTKHHNKAFSIADVLSDCARMCGGSGAVARACVGHFTCRKVARSCERRSLYGNWTLPRRDVIGRTRTASEELTLK
jgi:hypothetical protein